MAKITEKQRERRRERQRAWYQRYRVEKIQQVQRWKDDHPDLVLEAARRRRERRDDQRIREHYREQYPRKTPRQIEELVREYKEAAARPSLHWT